MTYKYFFGSDNRSIPYLNTLIDNYDSIKVVTTEPRNTGRGRKILNNPVEDYCRKIMLNFLTFLIQNIMTIWILVSA